MSNKLENKSKKRLIKKIRKTTSDIISNPEMPKLEIIHKNTDSEKNDNYSEKQKHKRVKKDSEKKTDLVQDNLLNSDLIESVNPDEIINVDQEKDLDSEVISNSVNDMDSSVDLVKPSKKKVNKSTHKKNRKVNNKPLTSDKIGINVSPAKVKNIISNYVLNNDIYKAINELKHLERNGKPITDMSDETKLLVSSLNNELIKSKKKQYERSKYESFTVEEKNRYLKEKHKFKAGLTKYDKCIFNENVSFNGNEFNLLFDPKYYDDFSCDLSYTSNYTQLIKACAKSKYRFSNNSRLYLSSFIELLIRQIAYNSIYTCIKNDRKIIQVEHNLTKNTDLCDSDYSLFNLVKNLRVSNDYVSDDDSSEVIVLENLTSEKQQQFKYYISETCREIKQSLSVKYPEKDSVYNHTSISKNFKNYGSSIVCEVLIIIGKMIRVEIESRSVKTVNDGVIKTVLEQLHLANNIDFKITSEFINSISKKYTEYIVTKKNEKVKKSTPDSEVNVKLEYEPEHTQDQL